MDKIRLCVLLAISAAGLNIALPIQAQPVPISSAAMADAIVARHNHWRQQRSLPDLQWADDLARSAQQWSRQLAGTDCQMVHSSGNDLGENLFWASPRVTTWSDGREEIAAAAVTPEQVVDSWGEEVQWYDYDNNTCSAPPGKSCGHYTQLVWASTRQVGCAMSLCPDSAQIWACQYRPAGNVMGQRPY